MYIFIYFFKIMVTLGDSFLLINKKFREIHHNDCNFYVQKKMMFVASIVLIMLTFWVVLRSRNKISVNVYFIYLLLGSTTYRRKRRTTSSCFESRGRDGRREASAPRPSPSCLQESPRGCNGHKVSILLIHS